MTTTTVFGQAADGRIISANATYATARTGPGTGVDTSGAAATVGQQTGYNLFEGGFSWDTSTVPAGENVDTAALSFVFASAVTPATNFVLEARDSDWGATLTTGDWIAGASLSGLTLLASVNTSGLTYDNSTYNDITANGGNLAAWVKTTGTSRLLLVSDQLTAGNAPTTSDILQAKTADNAGTTIDPKLVITSSLPPTPLNIQMDAAQQSFNVLGRY